VNGSETLYQKEKEFWQEKSPVFGASAGSHDRKIRVTARRHREHDELRYSVRSIFKYLNNGFSGIRILASDFYDKNTTSWIGQTPNWLDLEAARRHGVTLLHTSDLYGAKNSYLPVFNSLAIESQFYSLPPTENDVMLYLNDDMFLGSEHSASDFWNPVLGITMQLDSSIIVENQDPSVAEFQADWNSEWKALRYSNFLLSKASLERC
jgi:Stealth protein CR2, conserved region 2